MIVNTFRDFFSIKLVAEKTEYPSQFQSLFEMAIRGDIAKKPVNFDEDDIEFLNQFPHAYWAKAKQQRYDMLHKAIEGLHNKRKSAGQDALKDKIINAMQTQNWDQLRGEMPEEMVQNLSRRLNPEKIQTMSPKQRDFDADKIAFDFIKDKNPHLEAPEEAEFTFQDNDFDPHTGDHGKDTSSARTKKKVTFVAKPFLNRLYHKLERTRGLEHLPDSGLTGVGKYGYDMAEPKAGHESEHGKFKNSTAGMVFPGEEQTRDRIRDFMNLNQHEMFGKLPKDVKWLPTKYNDHWTIDRLKRYFEKEAYTEMKNSGNYDNESKIAKLAREYATERVLELAKQGALKGPPVPGKFPDGIPAQVRGKQIILPLYLPHKLQNIRVKDENGQIKTIQKEVPIVNPAHYFRELGSEESDYAQEEDENGKIVRKYDQNGKPIYNVPADRLRGNDSSFVHVGDNEFKPNKHYATGGLTFNKNMGGRENLTPGDEGYDQAFEKVFNDQDKVVLDKNKIVKSASGGFYEDIMRGIMTCYRSENCGGSTSHERSIMLQNIEDVHQIIVQKMLQNLRNEVLYSSKGRVTYAKDLAAAYAQRDLGEGGGTRRKRNLTQNARNVSFDTTTSGKEGGQLGIGDELSMRVKDQSKTGLDGGGPIHASDKRGKGDHRLDTSGQNSPYDLDNYRQLSDQARQVDAESAKAIEISKQEIGDNVINSLQDVIKKRAAVADEISSILTALYQHEGSTPEDAKEMVDNQIKAWAEDGYKSEQMVNALQQHPLVQKALASKGQGEVTPAQKQNVSQEDEKAALDHLNQDLETMRNNGRNLEDETIKGYMLPKPGQKFGQYVLSTFGNKVGEIDKDRVLGRVQDEINRLYKTSGVQPKTTQAARAVDIQGGSQDRMRQIMAQRKLGQSAPQVSPELQAKIKTNLMHAQNPQSLRNLDVGLLQRLHDWIEKNQANITPEEYAKSINSINSELQRRKI